MASLSTPSHFSSYFSCHIPRTHCIFKPHWFLLSVVPLLTSKPATQRQHCFPWAFNTVAVFNYLICEQILLAKHMLSKGNTDRKPKPKGPQIRGTKLQSCFIPRAVQFSSVTQSCPTLCNPMNRRTPGLPLHHQLPEFTQTHAHRVGDAIQPSHPLSSPSPPGLNPSQHQGLFHSRP